MSYAKAIQEDTQRQVESDLDEVHTIPSSYVDDIEEAMEIAKDQPGILTRVWDRYSWHQNQLL
jgi:hypothetical protein